jgi:hypothetical protein
VALEGGGGPRSRLGEVRRPNRLLLLPRRPRDSPLSTNAHSQKQPLLQDQSPVTWHFARPQKGSEFATNLSPSSVAFVLKTIGSPHVRLYPTRDSFCFLEDVTNFQSSCQTLHGEPAMSSLRAPNVRPNSLETHDESARSDSRPASHPLQPLHKSTSDCR